jgi:large conductance mechanosensitive channel
MACCTRSLRRWGTVIRDFAARGQLLDLAAALVIGHTFEKVIQSFVDNLLVPILGFLFDGTDISLLNAKLKLDRRAHKPPIDLPYGKFLQELIYFVVIAISLSITIAIINKIFKARQKSRITTEQLPTRQELILMEHTNLLKQIVQQLRQ